MFVTKNLNCYKMGNNGWISIVKVSIGAHGHFTSEIGLVICLKMRIPTNTLIFRIVLCCYFFGRDFSLTSGNLA